MNLLSRNMFRYGFLQQCPTDRLSLSRIESNIGNYQFHYQLINNIHIAYNCTKTAIKYSKCYLCRIPFVKYPLQIIYGMQDQDRILNQVQKLFLSQCPVPKYQMFFSQFTYENKFIYPALSLIKSQNLSLEQQKTAVSFLTALELVNLGFSLHHSIGSKSIFNIESHKLNLATRIALRLMSKQMKDSYLVLGGDYFHIKGSTLAAQTNNVRLSELLSEVQIDTCKYVHLAEQLKNKIKQEGYDKVEVKQIYNISILKTCSVVKGLMAMDIITSLGQQNQEIYEIMGLLILYRKDLQDFMFNFKTIVQKYIQYTTQRKINFASEESLPYYIFFKGANNNQRIDKSYLNTVSMMSEEINYLENKLKELLGQSKAKELEKKMSYYLMIYS